MAQQRSTITPYDNQSEMAGLHDWMMKNQRTIDSFEELFREEGKVETE